MTALCSKTAYPRLLRQPTTSFFLLGARGVGKSTWARLQYGRAHRIDLLDEALYQRLLAEPELFAGILQTVDEDEWVVVDEVQRIPSLLNEVHRFIEEHSLRFALGFACGYAGDKPRCEIRERMDGPGMSPCKARGVGSRLPVAWIAVKSAYVLGQGSQRSAARFRQQACGPRGAVRFDRGRRDSHREGSAHGRRLAPGGGDRRRSHAAAGGVHAHLAARTDGRRTARRARAAHPAGGALPRSVGSRLRADDLVVRRAMQQKMEFLAASQAVQEPPTEEEIEAFFCAAARTISSAGRVEFRQVYLSPDQRGAGAEQAAIDLLAMLRSEDPDRRPSPRGGMRSCSRPPMAGQTEREVSATFGEVFAEARGVSPSGSGRAR